MTRQVTSYLKEHLDTSQSHSQQQKKMNGILIMGDSQSSQRNIRN